jgi:hypothetical protein
MITSKADRSAISRAVAKAIAYHDCGKPEKAATWAAEVELEYAQQQLKNDRMIPRIDTPMQAAGPHRRQTC